MGSNPATPTQRLRVRGRHPERGDRPLGRLPSFERDAQAKQHITGPRARHSRAMRWHMAESPLGHPMASLHRDLRRDAAACPHLGNSAVVLNTGRVEVDQVRVFVSATTSQASWRHRRPRSGMRGFHPPARTRTELLAYLFSEVLGGRNAHLTDGVQRVLVRPPRSSATTRGASHAGVWTEMSEVANRGRHATTCRPWVLTSVRAHNVPDINRLDIDRRKRSPPQ